MCRIVPPSVNETDDVLSYFSGHYQCYGINVQAACDALGRCTHLSVQDTGVTPDCQVFSGSSLSDSVNGLPYGYYVVGDCAYIISNKFLTPYSGRNKDDRSKDSFNFHLSQLRIRIEQVFGMIVNKFLIFQSPLKVPLRKVKDLVQCAFRLHNFCVDRRQYKVPVARYNPVIDEPFYMPFLDHDNNAQFGRSSVRDAIRARLEDDGTFRPQYNRL